MSVIDSDLLAARRGDRSAFGRLVRAHAMRVCATTTAIVGDPGLGEDVAQQAFVAAWRQLGQLREPSRFSAWLLGIARRRAHDAVRRRKARREVGSPPEVVDPRPPVTDRLDEAREETELWAALSDLDEPHRVVLALYYQEGRSVAEVSAHLELSESTVRQRLSRGRRRLRDAVQARLSAARVVAVTLGALAGAPSASAAAWLPPVVAAVVAAAALLLVVGLPTARSADPPPTAERATVVAPRSAPAVVPDSSSVGGPVPRHVRDAFLAAEDARFFEHGGVDPWAISRAAWHTVAGGARQGGSTITQQVAKRQTRHTEPGLGRKVSEVWLAWQLERALTKEQILERYLAAVYLGAGAHGVTEGARVYFDKAVSDLTVGEAALLAGLPAAPQATSPFVDPEAARARRNYVVGRMEELGWIDAPTAAVARAEPLPHPR